MRKTTLFLLNLFIIIVVVASESTGYAEGAENFLNELGNAEVSVVKPPEKEDHNGHHGHHHVSGGHEPEGHMMKMWFHGGYDEVVLFEFWRTDSFLSMLLSCTAIFIMGATYEGVKWFRVFLQITQSANEFIANKSCVEIPLQSRTSHNMVTRNISNSNSKIFLTSQNEPFLATTVVQKSLSPFAAQRIIQGLLYIFQLVLAYWLMLIVMTYNTYLTAAVVLGAGFGHWLFAVLQLRNTESEATDSFQTDACH